MPHSSKYARLSLFLLVLLVAAIGVNAYDAVPLIAWSGKKYGRAETRLRIPGRAVGVSIPEDLPGPANLLPDLRHPRLPLCLQDQKYHQF